MAIVVEYGKLYYGSIYNNPESILDVRKKPIEQYIIMPIRRINKLRVLVHELPTGRETEYSVRHFQKNFVLVK